jgi:hypothetical protein
MNIPGFTASASLYCNGGIYTQQSAACDKSSSAIRPQLRAGGGGATKSCVETYQDCYVDCSVRYPESSDSSNNLNALLRQGCFDSCDAAYRLCSPARGANSVEWFFGRIGRGIGRIARRAAPIVG